MVLSVKSVRRVGAYKRLGLTKIFYEIQEGGKKEPNEEERRKRNLWACGNGTDVARDRKIGNIGHRIRRKLTSHITKKGGRRGE